MKVKYKILIVDDEQSILDMLKLRLQFEGYIVLIACNAKEPLDKLFYKPDIILLDINIVGMNGFYLSVSICDFISWPIIFLTARDDYITKPFLVNELLARISAHLRCEQRSHNKLKSKFSEEFVLDYSNRSLCIKASKIEIGLPQSHWL